MDAAEFHDRVTASTDADLDDPEPIADATLETLGEAVSRGQADDVAEYLPDRYAESLREGGARTGDEGGDAGEGGTGGDGAASLSREQFLERARDRAREYADGDREYDADEIRTRASAVTDALAESIPREEHRGLRSQLPDDVEALFTEGEGTR